ncbi:MAG: M23 family metallopeptidase [Chloroflexota bacterium]
MIRTSSGRFRGLAAAALATLLLGSLGATAAAHPPRFLTLPFADTRGMHVEDGWWRVDGTFHHGIDYIKGRVGVGSTWQSFPIVAAADGWACAALDDKPGCISGVGTRILIRHVLPNGHVYLTYYGHLRKIAPEIAVGTDRYSTHVTRGQIIGWAGKTGLPGTGTHLHFELMTKPGKWIDPYDIRSTRERYPDPAGKNALVSGPGYWWTQPRPVPPPVTAGFGAEPLVRGVAWAA